MSVQFGGRTLTIDPSLAKVNTDTLTHDGYGLFDAYISMMVARDQAIELWERVGVIHFKLDSGSKAIDMKKVQARLDTLESQLLQQEGLFLQHERAADIYWQRMSVTQRKEEEVDVLLGINANQKQVLGLWRHPLGESRLPPEGMRIDRTVLQFCPPAQAKVYGGRG